MKFSKKKSEVKKLKFHDDLETVDLENSTDLITLQVYKTVPDSELAQYMENNKIYIKLFYTMHDKRTLFRHNFWRKLPNSNIQDYAKKYINVLTERLKINGMHLTEPEFNSPWEIHEYDVEGYQGINLKTVTIKSWVKNENNNKWVIVVHGLNSHKFRSIFFGLIYLRLGYNILVYDQRNHGESGKSITTMGYNEKYDLAAIVNFLKTQFKGSVDEINFHGWSMGTFVIVEYLKEDYEKERKLIKWIVLDSTVANLNDLYRYYILKLRFNYFERFYAIRRYAIDTRGYDPEELNPGEELEPLKQLPFLYILNKRDHTTPYLMGEKAYQNKIASEKPQLSVKVDFDGDHVRGIYNDPDNYLSSIAEFIKKYSK